MRAGLPELLALLRDQSEQLTLGDAQWAQVFDLAEQEHLLPWAAHLCSAQTKLPQHTQNRLRAIQREAAIAAFYWIAELSRILAAFAKSEIKIVPLKGPFLGERLYGDAALRVNYDLDILVSKRDLPEAEELLSELGFTPGIPDDYHRQWYRGPTTVELHHDVENPLAFHYDTTGALARAQPALFQGQPCWQLTAADELLFLCLHAVRHRFERLSLIVDLCLAFERLTPPASHSHSNKDCNKLLLVGLAMARKLQSDTQPQSPIHASPAITKHLEALADDLWEQLTTQPSETLDWRALHSFYLDVELPGLRLGRRVRHLQILMRRLIAPDYEFAASLGFHRAWQARLLRPVRLMSAVFRNAAQFEGQA